MNDCVIECKGNGLVEKPAAMTQKGRPKDECAGIWYLTVTTPPIGPAFFSPNQYFSGGDWAKGMGQQRLRLLALLQKLVVLSL